MTTNDLVNHVDAVFGGQSRQLKMEREDLSVFEVMAQMPAYQMFTKIAGGFWTVSDLQTVIAFALIDWTGQNNRLLRHQIRTARDIGMSMPLASVPKGIIRKVEAVINDRGPANYAPLALKLLEASLFGLKPEDAHFDEGDIGEPG